MVSFKKINSEEYKLQREQIEKEEEKKELLRCQTALGTGHRPNKLGNCYSLNHPMSIAIKDKLIPVLEELIIREGVTRFITGGAIGWDQVMFWTVQVLKKKYPYIKNIVAIPFKNQDAVWKDPDTLKWYKKMLEIADEVINVEGIDGYKTNEDIPYGDYSIKKMGKRNEYMVDNGKYIVAGFDGSKGGTANCLYYARHCYKGHILYRLHPKYDFELDITYIC